MPARDGSPAATRDAAPAGRAVPAEIDDAGLAVWFTAQVADVELPLRYQLITGGHSNLTFEVTDAAGRRFVLRRPPRGHLLPTAHDMGREYRIIAALGAAGMPVPAAIGYCEEAAVTGAPFFVMSFVDGLVLRAEPDIDGVFDGPARYRIGEAMVDTLCAIHALDPDRIGLGDLSRRQGYIARQLKRWYAQYVAGRDEQGGPDVAEIDTVHAALEARIPPQAETVVVHGDYRLDNTVIGTDGHVAAVLDWELCALG
ncbi:MAG TPA: phosphotransferase family protein, partial [Acidimicrobiales bacterium]